jgi:uncharacterized protein (TIGR03435 family)
MRTKRTGAELRRRVLPEVILVTLAVVAGASSSLAQSRSASPPDWMEAAGGRMAFDSATVAQNTSPPPYRVTSSFPLGPGDVYVKTGGIFRARNFPVFTYITFAYKVTESQRQFLTSQLPKWAFTDLFDIEAKTQGSATKDQMRLMVQTLLADRFRLSAHYEMRDVPVFALVLDQPGKLGPLLQKHPEDVPCPTTPWAPSPAPMGPPQFVDARFPENCGGIVDMAPSVPGRVRRGARNVSLDLVASSMTSGPGSEIDRPVLNETGLTGTYDVAIEFGPDTGPTPAVSGGSQRDSTAPTYLEALRVQMGLRLEPRTGPVTFLVIDYIEEPPAN